MIPVAEEIGGQSLMAMRDINDVMRSHTEGLMSIPGVVGTAQGLCNNTPCIKVFVIEKTKVIDQKIPNVLEGYPIVIEETGEIRPLSPSPD